MKTDGSCFRAQNQWEHFEFGEAKKECRSLRRLYEREARYAACRQKHSKDLKQHQKAAPTAGRHGTERVKGE